MRPLESAAQKQRPRRGLDGDWFGQRSVTGEQGAQHRRRSVGTGFRTWHDEGDARPTHTATRSMPIAARQPIQRSDAYPRSEMIPAGGPGLCLFPGDGGQGSSDHGLTGCPPRTATPRPRRRQRQSTRDQAREPGGSCPVPGSGPRLDRHSAGADCRRWHRRSRRTARHNRSRRPAEGRADRCGW